MKAGPSYTDCAVFNCTWKTYTQQSCCTWRNQHQWNYDEGGRAGKFSAGMFG